MQVSGWNVALQVANFLVLAFLLQRFLWRPVARVIEERQAEVATRLGEAAAERAAAEEAQREYEQKIGGIAAERGRAVEEARRRSEEEAERIRAEAEGRARALGDEASAQIAEERARALAELRGQATRLALAVAERLLREVGGCDQPFLDRAVRTLEGPEERERFARQLEDGRVEVVSASPLGESEERRLGAWLEGIAGRPVSASFRVDPTLLAGVELRSPRGVWKFHWQDSLARIDAALREHGGAG